MGGLGVEVAEGQGFAVGHDFEAVNPPQIRAGTVHIAQGDEADLVIFDLVKANHRWLVQANRDIDRLINVALSRARTQVIVVAQRNRCRRTPFWKVLHQAPEYHLVGQVESPRLELC